MRINWKRFATVFFLFNVIFLFSGCSASWIGAVQALMPAISAAISAVFAFISALTGKTIPASVTAAIQKVQADISATLTNVQTLLAEVAQNASQTVLSQIESAFQSVVSNLSSILSGLSITDPATQSKLQSLISLAVAAVEAVLAIIPLASKAVGEKDEAHLLAADKAVTSSIKNTHKVLKADYHTTVTTLTGEADVDVALAGLEQTLP
jgi:hypothetical protein